MQSEQGVFLCSSSQQQSRAADAPLITRVKFLLKSSILVSGHCLTLCFCSPASSWQKGSTHFLNSPPEHHSWVSRGTANSRCSHRWNPLQLQGKSDAPTHIHRGINLTLWLCFSSSSCSFLISPRGWGKRGVCLLSTVSKLFNSLRVCLQSWKLSWTTGLKRFKAFGLYQLFKDKHTPLLASFTQPSFGIHRTQGYLAVIEVTSVKRRRCLPHCVLIGFFISCFAFPWHSHHIH